MVVVFCVFVMASCLQFHNCVLFLILLSLHQSFTSIINQSIVFSITAVREIEFLFNSFALFTLWELLLIVFLIGEVDILSK